ncbi:MAG: hypothetical protein WCF23_24435 [Candidatus Nitrosopolaris sp.]
MGNENINRADGIVKVLQAVNFGGGLTLAKITEKVEANTITAVERMSINPREKWFNCIPERRASLSNDIQGNALITNVQPLY